MKKISLTIFTLAVAFLSSCYYDNFKELRPEGAIPVPCDSSGVISYSTHIVPIMQKACTQNCHNGTGNGNRDLTQWVNVNDAAISGINPGDGGSLYGTVNWDPNYGNDMPKNGSKLSDCDIAKIRKWAVAGGLDN